MSKFTASGTFSAIRCFVFARAVAVTGRGALFQAQNSNNQNNQNNAHDWRGCV